MSPVGSFSSLFEFSNILIMEGVWVKAISRIAYSNKKG
jgi:hypothetical protein